MPQIHMLFILNDLYKVKTADQIEQLISAEMPSVSWPAHDLVVKHMVHSTSGSGNKNEPFMVDGQCSKHYPKSLKMGTEFDDTMSIPFYWRRHESHTSFIKSIRNHWNQWV